MQLIQKYLLFWPVLLASFLFLLLGLGLYLISERAMERSEKDLRWVRTYRRQGFPFRKELLPWNGPGWGAFAAVVVFAVLFRIGLRASSYYLMQRRWSFPPIDRYHAAALLVAAVGAASVYLTVLLTYESRFAAFWSAMLFAASPLSGHGIVSLLAAVVLLLLLYLRTETPGFPAELLYLAAILVLAVGIGACHPMVWMIPVLILAHLFKLVWHLREGQLRGLDLILALVAALFGWLVCIVLAALLRRFIDEHYSVRHLLALLNPLRIRYACSELLAAVRAAMFSAPRLGRLVSPLTDAPLLGFGFWGAVSALGMLCKRRSVRGFLACAVLLFTGLIWLLSGRYTLPLGLAVASGALFANADIGKRRLPAGVCGVLGLAYDVAMVLALWALPLYIVLIQRILYV